MFSHSDVLLLVKCVPHSPEKSDVNLVPMRRHKEENLNLESEQGAASHSMFFATLTFPKDLAISNNVWFQGV